jgi:hypothetical protein
MLRHSKVNFRPFELIAFRPTIGTYEMLANYGIPYGCTTDILIKPFFINKVSFLNFKSLPFPFVALNIYHALGCLSGDSI